MNVPSVPGFPGFPSLGFPVPGFPDPWVSLSLGFPVPGFPCPWVSLSLGFPIQTAHTVLTESMFLTFRDGRAWVFTLGVRIKVGPIIPHWVASEPMTTA